MKYYAVLDTNVIVSAMLRWRSVPGSLLELAFDGVIVPVLNEEIVAEYRNVLARPKFHLTEEIIEDFISGIEADAGHHYQGCPGRGRLREYVHE